MSVAKLRGISVSSSGRAREGARARPAAARFGAWVGIAVGVGLNLLSAPDVIAGERTEPARLMPTITAEAPEALFRRALDRIEVGGLAEAGRLLDDVLRLDPYHVDARKALGALRIRSGRMDEAIALLEDGLEIDPSRFELAILSARLRLTQQDTAGALLILRRHEYHPRLHDGYNALLGALYQHYGRYGDAVVSFGRAVLIAPDRGAWWANLGVALQSIGRHDEARPAFAKALSDPALPAELRKVIETKLDLH